MSRMPATPMPHPEWCECNQCDEDCHDFIAEEEYDEMYRLGPITPPLPDGTDRIARIDQERW